MPVLVLGQAFLFTNDEKGERYEKTITIDDDLCTHSQYVIDDHPGGLECSNAQVHI